MDVTTSGYFVRMEPDKVEVVRREPMGLVAVRESGYGNYSYDKLGADGKPTGPLPMAATRERGRDDDRRPQRGEPERQAAYHQARRRTGR